MVIALEYETRPVRRRTTARVLVVDPTGNILLLEDSDATAPGQPSIWITPGGGLEGAETPAMAAVRELTEETGLVVDPGDLEGPFGERTVVHGYSDKIDIQREIFFVVWTDRFTVTTTGRTADEQLSLRSTRWWAAEDIGAAGDQLIWPVGLASMLTAVADPGSWPIALSEAEESTVPWE